MTPGDLSLLFPGDGEIASLMRQTDWAQTTLGPVESWPNALKTAVRIVLTSKFSMWMAWGPDLAFLYNDAYRRDTLGTKHPRALGAKTAELWSEIWDDISPRIMRVLSEGHATWDEDLLLLLERNGYREETYHTFSYSPLHDDDGHIRGVLSVVTESTARVISERRVALLGQLGGSLATVNTEEGVIQALTQTLAAESRALPFTATYLFDDTQHHYTLAAKTGFAASDTQPPSTLVAGVHPWAAREAIENAKAVEVPLAGDRWPTGPWSTAATRVLVVPLVGRGGTGVTGLFVAALNPFRPFDAAYREFIGLFAGQVGSALANAHTYEQERKRAESLAELDRAKTVFFSNVSHEFRTPLTLMLGPLRDLLDDSAIPTHARDELDIVHRNGERLLKLVNTMLDFSRIEAGRATAHFQPLDLGALTADLASVFRAATDRAGIKLVVECERFEELVEVDPDMWEKIVLNLVSNAFKFTLSGSIEVTLSRRAGVARLGVRDSGIGIPPNEVAHVFDRFHRVEGSRGRTQEGTGIGLALVQELVRLHDGTITVESEVGRGTTFTVEIPLRTRGRNVRAATENPLPRRESNAYVAEAIRWLPDQQPPEAAEPPIARARVLVADDNADMRAYMARLLGSRWQVETVGNGREALEKIAAQLPDLVITDVMMPELDGFGLLAAVRAQPETATLPVLMLSARAGEEARVEGLQAGANDYLVKPFTSRELVARVDSLLLQAAERKAEERHARQLATIFEQAPVAMAVLRGPTHVFQIANARYRGIVGHRPILGKSLAEVLPEVVEQGFVDILDNVFRSQEPFFANSIPIRLTDQRDGNLSERIFDLVYHPMVDGDGNSTGIAAIGHDVTDITLARREAEAANRSKDEFLAMLGHELRNPLAPIITALELLATKPDVGGMRERAVIERQVKHLVSLVDDLLDISRITRGKVELRPTRVAITDILARSIEQASPLFEQQQHELVVDVSQDLFVHGDPARLAQVMSNLLTNAAKYTQRRGRVEVRARRADSTIIIDIQDNGIGIEPTLINGIFEPFAQATQAIDRSRGGLGLGLAIVSSLVKLHNGRVRASSGGPGNGSTFTIELPVDDGDKPHETSAPATQLGNERHARVLVVDDNIDAALLLVDLLEARGYAAIAAHDGPGALRVMETFRPEIAVLDIGLPVMDGFELARAIRTDERFANTKLVALTGYGQAQDRERTKDAGFVAHFVKPVDNFALHTQLQVLLGD